MNFQELKDRLRASIKNPDPSDVTEVMVGQYINDGYRDLATRYPYHQTRKRCQFTTEIGEKKYQLPSDCTVVMRISDLTTGRKLRKLGDRDISDRLISNNFRPTGYQRYRNYIELAPTPDAAYVMEVFYNSFPGVLTSDTECPVLPPSWHNGIWMKGKWYYYMDQGDISQQTAADNAYKLWLADKPSEIEEESADIDSGVAVPTLGHRSSSSLIRRFDDGLFDFED